MHACERCRSYTAAGDENGVNRRRVPRVSWKDRRTGEVVFMFGALWSLGFLRFAPLFRTFGGLVLWELVLGLRGRMLTDLGV